ncbi:hypothetical protein MMC13_000561 [Lambiella insularis]|nr:hypothetical protein [Lambiella insularis]
MAVTVITPFEVEEWMNTYEGTAKFNIAETCAASISIEDLQNLSEAKTAGIIQLSTKLVYGAIRGSENLRTNLSRLYSAKTSSPLPSDNILITPGAIAANFALLYALIRTGDHIICHYPTYQQLYSVPANLGAEVSLWRAQEDKKWQLDIEELKTLIQPNTKMIIINNPQNPTGAIIPKSTLEQIVEIARKHDLIVFSDEVYRPLFHSIGPLDPAFPPSILSMAYPKAIATGSLSKAYAMAGLRIGWIASRSRDIIEACASARDYTTISVSALSDQVASFALSPDTIHALLGRNIQLAKTNLALLEEFIDAHSWACQWTKPVAGTTAFVKFAREGRAVDDVEFCKLLHERKGVMVCPGSRCFGDNKDFKGYIRIGFANETRTVKEGLDELRAFMRDSFAEVPLATL